MQPKQSANRFRCLNCGSIVHWTDFTCEVCGRNPREKETVGEVYMPEPNIMSKLKTALRLFRDEFVYLDFAINGIPIHAKARVVHIRKGIFEDIFTMGVCFEAIAREHREILNHHLAVISEENPRVQCFA
jgi:hypothetical protein